MTKRSRARTQTANGGGRPKGDAAELAQARSENYALRCLIAGLGAYRHLTTRR